MTRKIFGRIPSARSLVFAMASLAALALSAFDTPYLTFRSASSFSISGTSSRWTGDGGYLEYATSNPADSASWSTWSGSYISAAQTAGQYYIYLRGKGISSFNPNGYTSSALSLSATRDVYCEGDIETLRGYDGDVPAMGANCYKYMFNNWSRLKSPPVLSATTLAESCYESMFYFSGITNAPALPATTLANKCYTEMFSYCSSLISAPALPAMTMTSYCYRYMFNGCSSLVAPPALPATTLADECYARMFQGCTSIKTLPSLPATTSATSCYNNMFSGCIALEVNTSGPGVEWSIPSEVGIGELSYNSGMFGNTGGSFTGNPVAGTIYKVASALPPGEMYQTANGGTLTPVFAGSSHIWDLSTTVKNGTAPYTFVYAGGTPPPGLEVGGSTLSGTPTTPGTYNFTMTVTDDESHVWNDAPYTLFVMEPLVSVETTFVGADGASATTNCLVLNTDVEIWESGWYVVTNSLDYGTGGITIAGDVNLVLANGASLTVVGATDTAGIRVTPGNSFTIYGQSDGSGSLSATGVANGAGIGGCKNEHCGAVTINGGIITAKGGDYYSAGIGGGYYGNGGTVTINGGTVTATGGSWYGAGIGGGYYGNGGTVMINGGTVTATAGSSGAGTSNGATGIGKGYGSGKTVGSLTVGSAVSVKAGSTANPTTEIGRGGTITIGTQRYFYVETLSMTQVENSLASYTGESKVWNLVETIVGGVTPYTFSGTVPSGLMLNSNGTLTGAVAAAGTYPFTLTVTDDAGDSKNFSYTLTVTAPDPITATQTSLSATVGKVKSFTLADTVSGGVPPYTFAMASGSNAPDGFTLVNGVLSGTSATAVDSYVFTVVVTDALGTIQNVVYTFTAAESTGFADDDPEEPASGDSVDCRTADGVVRQRSCIPLTSSSKVWDNCWYYVAPNTTLSIAGVVVSNKVSLVLGDGATLTVQGASSKAGIRVAVEGSVTNSLTIYCQGAGTGKLVAKGGSAGAGIGGDNRGSSTGTGLADCGKVTIYGGVIEATGSGDAAGIGGGDWYGKGGTIAIYGGTVTASAGSSSAVGVGRGYGSTTDSGTLTVGERILVKAGSSANPTTELPHGANGEITLVGQRYFTFEATAPAPLEQLSSAFAAYIGDSFELALAGTVGGGTPAYTFTQKSGTLPAGLHFSDGVVSGTPTAAAFETVVFTVTDSGIGTDTQSEDFSYTFTVTAKPKPITYKDGETVLTGLLPTNYVEGVVTDLPATAPAPAGYDFAGWYDNSGLSGLPVSSISASSTGERTFWAKWTPTVYTVTYMTDATTPITDQNLTPTNYTIESADLPLPAAATKAGKGFYGWHTNSSCTGDAVTTIPHGSTGNKTFYAKWGAARGNESYIDGTGNPQIVECAEMASDSTSLSAGWYIVKGNVAISSKVTVSGAVKLILADDATLTVNSSAYGAGIEVKGENSLTIYAQAKGNGALTVTASNGPGIGSNDSANPCGTITIYGGNVTVNGNYAGIGGGWDQPGGNVYVYGGTVIATSGSDSHAGIGGSYSRKAEGSLTVGENQIVMAKTANNKLFAVKPSGAGGTITLGGERYYKIITPESATVSYRDTDGTDKPVTCRLVSEEVFALPGGWYAVTNSLTLGVVSVASNSTVNLIIADGALFSVTGIFYNAGISVPVGSSLTIYGQSGGTGTISATGGYYGAGMGGCYGDSSNPAIGGAGAITINGGIIIAQGGAYAAGIGGGYYGNGGIVMVNGGTVTAISGNANASGIGKGTSFASGPVDGTLTIGAMMAVTAGADAGSAVALDPDGSGAITLSGEDYYHIERSGPVELTQLTGELQALKGASANWRLSTTVGGGTPPYTFAAKAGFEPPSFLALENGVLSGIPTAAGTYQFTLVVTDDASAVIEAGYTLTVANPPTLAATQTALGNVAKNAAVNIDLATTVTGGIPGYTFAEKVANSLPDGLSLTSAGVISGAPTTAGTYPFTIVVTDSASPANVIEVPYTLVVKEVYAITYKARDGMTGLVLAPATYVEGTGVAANELPVPVESGWTFLNWYDNAGLEGDPVTSIPASATGDITLYSKWEEYATGNVPFTFVGADGNPQTETCTVIDDTMTTLSTGWYVVYNNVTFNSKALVVSGDVKIVLKDGRSMTATGSSGHVGIKVSAGNALTIYSQSAGTGSLSATGGGYYSAGIGGDDGEACGTVTIYGGVITVTGTSNGAGIGGGRNGNGGTVTVNGGNITASGGGFNAAGIGGGDGSASHGTLTVNGEHLFVASGYSIPTMEQLPIGANGAVSLDGNRYYTITPHIPVPVSYRDTDGADKTTNCVILASDTTILSSGWYAVTNDTCYNNATLTIAGDVNLVIADGAMLSVTGKSSNAGIHVTGGNALTIFAQAGGTGVITAIGKGYAAGIGGAYGESGGIVTINGGTVNVVGGDNGCAGIGGGKSSSNHGTLKVAANMSVCAGASENPSNTLDRNDVTGEVTLGGERYYKVAALSSSTEFGITYVSLGQPLNLVPATYSYGTGVATLPSPVSGPTGCTFAGWYDNAGFEGVPVSSIASDATGSRTFYAKWLASYKDGNGQMQTTPFTLFGSGTTAFETGWYLVDGEFSFNNKKLVVSGNAKLILADGASLTLTDTSWCAGICVPAGNMLEIYGQSEGTGVLNATGGTGGAGIGGSNETGKKSCGTVTINGGVVTATGNGSGAGIGGTEDGAGGIVTINGGMVTATGGEYSAPGIGKGHYSSGSHGSLVVPKANLIVTAGASANPTGTPARDSVTGAVTLDGERYYVIAPISSSSEFAITYMSAGAELNLSPATFTYGTGVASLPSPTAGDTPIGCTFGGWYASSEFTGSAVTSISADTAESVTLYAKWTPISESRSYIDENGVQQSVLCTAITPITETLTTGWYMVPASFSLYRKPIVVSGDVKLVLTDGNTLNVTSEYEHAAIEVTSGNSLTIYGQSVGTGVLEVYGTNGGAGIGGGDGVSGGAVAIYGGTVLAGATTGAGIGGGFHADSQGTLTVGSTMTVRAGSSRNNMSIRTANAGAVTLSGDYHWFLVSPPARCSITYMDGDQVLSGLLPTNYMEGVGAVLATPEAREGFVFAGWYANASFTGSSVSEIPASASGDKIFYGRWYALESVSYIDASGTAQTTNAAALTEQMAILEGGAYVVRGALSFLSGMTISGNVTLILAPDSSIVATGSGSNPGIKLVSGNSLAIYGQSAGAGSIVATGSKAMYNGIGEAGSRLGTLIVGAGLAVKAGESADPTDVLPKTASGVVTLANKQYYTVGEASKYAITYMDGETELLDLMPTNYVEGVGAMLAIPPAAAGFAFAGWYTNSVFSGLPVDRITAGESGNKTYYVKWTVGESVEYIDANGDAQTTNGVPLTAGMTNLVSGCYVAKGALDFGTGGIVIAGDVMLVLADGAAMSVTGEQNRAGITVSPERSLTIYGQTEGTGALVATGGGLSAGIGGDYQMSCGTVTVNGGNVTATGQGGAGIGGGYGGAGGTVTVNGGVVTAESNTSSARGIGGGMNSTRHGTLVVGPGIVAKGGSESSNLALLPSVESTGVVIVSQTMRCFRVEKADSAILPLTLVTGTFLGTNGVDATWALADTVCYGTKPYSFALKAGSALPDGFTFENGVITGTPAASGTYRFIVVVTDATLPEHQTLEVEYAINVSVNPHMLTQIVFELPEAKAGFNYTYSLPQTIEGGKKPYTFVQKEAMGCYPPSGINVSGTTRLSGIPTGPGSISTMTLVVTDANGVSTEASYRLNVEAEYVYTFDANDLTWKFIWSENTTLHETRIVLYNDGYQDGRDSVIDDATEGAIVIPSRNGRTSVTCIGDMAFYDCTNITSVTIPNGITAIGEFAFCGCTSLTSMRIPSSVVQMGDYAFCESALETVYVDPGTIASVSNLLVATDEDFDASTLEFIEVCDVTFVDGIGGATTNMMRYGQAIGTLPVLAREHYTFDGWFTAAEGGVQIDASTLVEQDVTYYAHWTIDTFTVTFAKNDGTDTVVESRRVAYGERVGTFPAAPTRDHYTFYYWWTRPENNAGTAIRESTIVTEDVTYYAHWTPDSVADWPTDTSTVAGQSAATAFEITGDLAGVDAKELADWAKGTGNVDFADRGDIIPEAFLLNCTNTPAAVTAATPVAEEAIKITAITIVDGVPQLTYPATYGNGEVVIQGSATIGSTASWHDGKQTTDRFFKTVLRLKQP